MRLPLVRNRILRRTGNNGVHNLLRILFTGKGAVKAFTAVSVRTLGRNDDHASFAACPGGSGHALYTLINILVKRSAAIGNNDNICGNSRAAAQFGKKLRSRSMCFNHIPCVCADNFFFVV